MPDNPVDPPAAPAVPSGHIPHPPRPMMAQTAKEPATDPDWWYEVKWDGYRILAETGPHGVRLWSRGGQDYTGRFAPVAKELTALAVPALFDGEMVLLDSKGRSSFQDLQNYLRHGEGESHLAYYAFDMLHLNGRDLTGLPLARRYELLQRALPRAPHLHLSEHLTGTPAHLLAAAAKNGLEGLMAKDPAGIYQPGIRSTGWLKLKVRRQQEMIVIGWTDPEGSRRHLGSLIVAVREGGRLLYSGHVGTGYTDADLTELARLLKPLAVPKCPAGNPPPPDAHTHWVRPQLVAEIAFAEWTDDHQLRQPSFLGLRDDKPAADVVREPITRLPASDPASPDPAADLILKLNSHTVTVTHPTKLYWPAEQITKLDLINYYRAVAPTLLPYLKDRPQSLNRFPSGITGGHFFQKNVAAHPAWIKEIVIHAAEVNRDVHYILCQNEATLVYMANLSCIELNPWTSRTAHLDNPDYCIIDLDPEGVTFENVINVAQTAHAVLNELKIPSYPKTSGSRGIHICVPLGAKYTYEQTRQFVHLIVILINQREPRLTSLERHPAQRQGKVYLDYLQNGHGQTLACAYSARPRPGATVSAPLSWDEIKPGLSPAQFTINNMTDRLQLDARLWQPILGEGIDLKSLLAKLEAISKQEL
jgi:bifunctional non-homologous end joining protein LigD